MKTNRIFAILLFATALFALSSCEKMFFEPMPENTPVAIFEYLWQDFHHHYAPFEERGVDWNEAYEQFRPQVTETTTDAALHAVLSQMLATLDDGHVNLVTPDRPMFRSNRHFRERTDDSLFSPQVIKERYLAPGYKVGEEDAYIRGFIGADIGYVWFDHVGSNWYIMNDLLETFQDVKGLIVDLRHNQGGDFTYAFANMGRLTAERRPVFRSQTKNGPGAGDFTPWHEWHLEPRAPIGTKGSLCSPTVLPSARASAPLWLFGHCRRPLWWAIPPTALLPP
jgi:carboxyl-terminal processing protease